MNLGDLSSMQDFNENVKDCVLSVLKYMFPLSFRNISSQIHRNYDSISLLKYVLSLFNDVLSNAEVIQCELSMRMSLDSGSVEI